MNSYQRQICGQSSKKRNRKNSTISKIVHINAKTRTATSLINTGVMAVICSIKCQRWDYSIYFRNLHYKSTCPKVLFCKIAQFFVVKGEKTDSHKNPRFRDCPLPCLPVQLPVLTHSGESLHIEVIAPCVTLIHPVMVAGIIGRMVGVGAVKHQSV